MDQTSLEPLIGRAVGSAILPALFGVLIIYLIQKTKKDLAKAIIVDFALTFIFGFFIFSEVFSFLSMTICFIIILGFIIEKHLKLPVGITASNSSINNNKKSV